MTWQKLQPMLTKSNRVCAYDRAGIGFSDGGPLPRNVDTNADDIEALISSAPLATPLILIGHSYGTDVVRRFADKHPDQVSALILLDPPAHAVGEFAPEFEKMEAEQNQAMLTAVAQCAKGAAAGQLDDPPPELKACLRPPNPAFSAELNRAIRANKLKPSFWQAIAAIAQTNVALYAQPIPANEHHGALPLIVLQPDSPFSDEPEDFRAALEKARQKTQSAIAATSTRGKIVPVEHSSHDVQMDRPDAVVAALDQVRGMLRKAPAAK
jgi:pimeloyl-ACP methyl ester carboxylesterase